MSVYLYRPGKSFGHRWHPVTKIAFLLFVFGVAVTFSHPAHVGALFGGVLLLGLLCGSGPNFRRLLPLVLAIAAFSLLLWPVFIERPPTLPEGEWAAKWGAPLFRLGTRDFRLNEVLYGLAMALRIASMLFAGLIYLTVARPEEFSNALQTLRLSLRLSFAFSLAFRLVPLFLSAAATVVLAQKGRGLELERGGPISRLRKYVPLFVPILVSAVRRGDQMAAALEARGFGRPGRRTVYPVAPFRASDVAWCVAFSLLLSACIASRALIGLGAFPP